MLFFRREGGGPSHFGQTVAKRENRCQYHNFIPELYRQDQPAFTISMWISPQIFIEIEH